MAAGGAHSCAVGNMRGPDRPNTAGLLEIAAAAVAMALLLVAAAAWSAKQHAKRAVATPPLLQGADADDAVPVPVVHSYAIDSAAAARSTPSPPATSHVDLPPPPPAVETTALLSAKAAASQAQPPCPTCGFGFEGYGNNCRFCAQCGQCQPMGNGR